MWPDSSVLLGNSEQDKLLQRSKEIETRFLPNLEDFGSRRGVPAVPGAGLSLAAATALRSESVRKAVGLLTESLAKHDLQIPFDATFGSRWSSQATHTPGAYLAARAAWNLVGIWLLAQASGETKPGCSLKEAEDWFLGSVGLPCQSLSEFVSAADGWRIEQTLAAIRLDPDFWELMPYVLEEHGPGSRASVLRDPKTATARAEKRSKGVFYTPVDVADFMVGSALDKYDGIKVRAKCLDPACGTGVFLLALLRGVESLLPTAESFDRFSYIRNSLFGCDISAQALDACAFVMLRHCFSDVRPRQMSPWTAWHSIRLNLVEFDAIKIEPPPSEFAEEPSESARVLTRVRSHLDAVPSQYIPVEVGSIQQPHPNSAQGLDLFAPKSVHLGDVFPDSARGFDLLLGNPPYARLGERDDCSSLVLSYHSLSKAESRYNNFVLFVEMMWRLTVPGVSASALVTPLSIAYHRGNQYRGCRRAMSSSGGRWQFAFFDRQPHALFGEEVKTRNAILFRFDDSSTPAKGEPAEIYTGPLRKWTSRTRKDLFSSIDFVSLGQTSIARGIPKLQNECQARAFKSLQHRVDRLPSSCLQITSCAPYEVFEKSLSPRVFVGGTAYNFLNVYRETSLLDGEKNVPLSESHVHCLEFQSERDAEIAFAILSSRLSFWLWHVLGDGFHVGGWLFNEVPFSQQSFDETDCGDLSLLGRRLWEKLQEHRFVSLNGGKQTIGFRPLACNEELDAIDALLIRNAAVPDEFSNELRSFVRNNAVVDMEDNRRNHVQKYFSASQST